MAADVYNDSRSWQGGYNLPQLQGNKEYGSEKKGHLLKKSHGIWKVWQRRKCAVQNGMLTISHARSNRQPAELNLLTCQVKPNAKSKKSFAVISDNRTYHFKAKDEQDRIAWVSVLTNSKEEALTVFFRGEQSTGEESLDSLTNAIIEDVQRLPGNDICCDCGSSEPTWLSTNLGILICIECSGIHREMGVHISRIQSLELDKLGTSELLLAKNVGNNRFNDIMEANLPSSSLKPNPSSDVTVRKEYIMAKYIDHRFSRKTCSSSSAKLSELLEAIRSRDLLALIQAYAEGVELMEPLLESGQELGETALHHAVRSADRTSLHLVYFLVQNSGNLNKQTALGNTVLHYCSMYRKPQCLKLLLRRKPMVDVVNQAGETALDIAKRLKATQCEDLLSQAKAGKFNPHVHVEYEWNLQQENMDESNEELDNKQSPIKKEHSPRPQSCGPSSSTSPQDKLSLLGFCTPGEKQHLSDDTFTSQISASTSAGFPTSPTSDAPLQRNLRDLFGPEFVKMTIEPFIYLDLQRSTLKKKGKNEKKRRKLNIMLLSGQRLELTCDTKTICKDVFDTVVAHIGLLEHHLFALATLKDNEYYFVDPDLKLTKVAPEGWKEEPKKKNIAMVNFTLFFRIQFFMDDVSLIQYSLTCHQYYLQLRKDILEERMHCDHDTSLLLASLALQAEYGDYQSEVHGVNYFRLEHYLPPRVMEKLDLSYIKEKLPKLHNTYVGDSKNKTELEFVKVCQRVTEYGVHLHRVCPEKKSQPGIVLGVCSQGVLVFEVHNGVRTLVLRSPWKDTKEISFSKKKFTFQNTSDGIKHAFQMDSSKVCKYLLHLCSFQLEFQLQMRARQRNPDAQETVPSTPVHMAEGMKNDMQKPSYTQDSAIDSSEDHRCPRGTLSHNSESSLGLSGGLREGSLSSQDSRAESASWSQRQVSGSFASHVGDRTWQESQHGSPSSSHAISKATEKKRASDSNQSKAKKPGISDAADSSDRGDSDMAEATSSSSQDHQTPEKESSSSMNTSNKMNCKTVPSSPPKPGDIFGVELAKNDDSLGISVTSSFGPEFVKMTTEPFISLDMPGSTLGNKGKNEENRRKLNIMLLSGQRLELTCDTKTICKDVFDTVVAHIGLVEHHFFALATLRDNEYFFIDPDLKLTKVAPEGWKEERKKKNIATVNFTLFFRIQFFVDDVSVIQYSLTCHQYYLQLRKDILEERMHCEDDTSLLLASLALQAEYGDYQPEVHGVSYFRLEHYLPPRVMEKLDLSYIKEALPKLHNTYAGASEKETELEFVKVCQRVTEYGVHLHRVRPEKKSQPGIVLGVCSQGVLVFEVHSGVRTLVLRSPWIDTKEISVSKKKFTLQNTSDGIKHAFQTDSRKVCRYLVHLCPSQVKFWVQMRARQRNRDAQETVPSTPVHMAEGMKNDMQKPSYTQDSAIDSSEDHRCPRGTLSHNSESSLGLSGGLREGSLSSQDSRAESASWSQRQVSGSFASHVGDRTWQESQHGSPSSSHAISKATEKKRASDSNQSKAKKPGISDAADSSDRGDSDMAEATSSSSQDHQTPEKESSSSMNTSNKMNCKTVPSSPPKPGDIFGVELAKNDDSLGISVTSSFGPEFVKMTTEPFISLDMPGSTLGNKGKNEENRRKLNIMLLSGQRLELTCDTKTICKDVFDTVVAHIGLVEHHFFALATLRDNEYFFIDPDLKLTKVAPEGWKEERKKKNIATVNFTLFFRIQFFVDDVSVIQYSLTCHQYYLQLRKDILEERMHCEDDTSLLLASLALQAEYGDYQPEVHGVSYFRLEHYLPPRVMEKLDLSYIKEALPKLHNTYAGASEKETELEFVKVCQRVTEYGVHLHRVRPEKKSQPGIVLGVCSQGVLVFEVHSGVRTLVLRSPWIDTKQISVSKKKFTLQNTSDGIKHAFQTDSRKVCRYLVHLCPSQVKFWVQMRARQRNRDAQETVPSTPVHMAEGMKNDMQKPSYTQDSAIDSSEDHRCPRGTLSHNSESSLGLSGGLQEGSLSSQDSRAESASWSQRQVSGSFASHVGDRTWQESQHGSPSSSHAISKATEKKRASDSNQSKAKKPGISDAADSSDRGDSDMAEATSSSSQDHQTPEKESSSSMNTSNKMNCKTVPSSPPKPGDIFGVELAKNDDSLGISVTSSFGPEFVKMTTEPFISLDMPGSTLGNKGKNEENRRKLNIMLLSGQRLELTCDTKTICKDVFDTVVAHIGLVEHHFFALATFKDNEYFFIDPDLKLTKVAPEGWKEERKKKNIATVNFTLFFRIQFFVDDVSVIQYSLTCHQYYLQLRKDILEERMHCEDDASLLLASLALQAEYGDYQPEVHGVSYFRLEHYLPPRVMEKLDLSYIKEALPKLHNTYAGASEKETELEFVKVCQRVTEYGVHLHRVRPEKKSQPGIVLGVCSQGVLVFEVHSGVRTLVLRSPWIDTKQISVSKKKFTLQNTSDGIKHAFQTDSRKVCRYLVHLCPSQVKFWVQMRARERNRDAQGTGDRVLAVNGVSLEGATHKQAVETLRNTGQLVHLLLEKGQSPASNGPVPRTPQCTLLDPDAQGQGPEEMMKKMTSVKDYSFVTEENTFEVKLFKNSSGLGFSFSREENLMNASIVRVKKLFPGHPAAESGKIDVGDVILKVNGASLKGLSQLEVIWALRRTSPEVSLLLCRPPSGVLPEMDPALLTPLHSPAPELPNSSKDTSQPACVEPGTSSDENEVSDKGKKPCTSPSWRDRCSDSSGSGEEDVVKAPAKIPKSDVQEDDFHDDPQEAEFIQSLLDVVDEEAQNLLIQNNVARDASVPGALKTNARISEERAEDKDCDGSPLPEDFTESTKMKGYEEYCEEKVKSESLIQKS